MDIFYDDYEMLITTLAVVLFVVYSFRVLRFLSNFMLVVFWLFCSVEYLSRCYDRYIDMKFTSFLNTDSENKLLDCKIKYLRKVLHFKDKNLKLPTEADKFNQMCYNAVVSIRK